MKLLDRISAGFGKLGSAAGQALDETRLQVEIMRARRRKDAAARDLGYLVFRSSQGATAAAGEQEALIQRIADIEKEIERLEAQAKELRTKPRGGKLTDPSAEPPPPAPAEPGAEGQG